MNAMTTEPKDLAGPAAAGRLVGLTPKRVRTLAARGKLTVVKLPGGRPMVSVAQLRELVQVSTTPALWGSGSSR
jgi:hypothetical protein